MKKKETKVVCPKCGTELEIPENEHVTIGVVIGKGIQQAEGTIVFNEVQEPATKAKKRMEALKKAGVNVSGLFAMSTGDIARLENGVLSVVADNDPIFTAILSNGTIPNRRLFRRWVMAQMFHLLTAGNGNFTDNLRAKGYDYQWKVVKEELKTQIKLYEHDVENYKERNLWFNKYVLQVMCKNYIVQLNKYIQNQKVRKCKGVPYIRLGQQDIFVADLPKRVLNPLYDTVDCLAKAESAVTIYSALCNFLKNYIKIKTFKMSTAFIDAYKGVGAYYTMKNLVLFHDCRIMDEKKLKANKAPALMSQRQALNHLKKKAHEYFQGDGWRMFGMMKKMLDDNDIDIKAKMASWRKR